MKKQIWKTVAALLLIFTLLVRSPAPVSSQAEIQPGLDSHSAAVPQNWLERFNYYRQAAGLSPVVESPTYSADLAKHVTYMLLNFASEGIWHGENPGRPGYTPEGAQAAAESNLAFGYPTPMAAMEGWMRSIHHRYGILRPDLATTGFGFGCDSGGCGAGLNVIRGIVWGANARPNGVFFPGANQRAVDHDVTLTWQFLSDSTAQLTSASLRDDSGQSVPFTTTSPANGDYFNMVSVDPVAPLASNTTYTASLSVQLGGNTLNQTWSFTTVLFADVPPDYWSGDYIERLYTAGITGGCQSSPLAYCPESTVTRAQMAIFLLKGIHGSSYSPPADGSTGFGDVDPGHWAGKWIKQLAVEKITGGCGSGNYCPDAAVTRAQMAIFLLKAKHGTAYTPPEVGGDTGFGDVPTDHWAGKWIKQLAAEGITGGCGSGNYCPDTAVTRAQMAVFLVKTFNLP